MSCLDCTPNYNSIVVKELKTVSIQNRSKRENAGSYPA